MRRLWAHIIIAFTCIVTVFACFPILLNNIQTNGDYTTRRQFTFQLTERKDENDQVITPLEDSSAKEMAKIMEQRLIAAGVTSYELSTSGKDMVNVAFAADNNSQYTQITTYLGFSGSFALMNKDPDSEPIVGEDFLSGNAYLKNATTNEYPTLIIPIDTSGSAYEALIKWAVDNPETSTQETEDGESQEVQSRLIYIIYNYQIGDTYKTLTENNTFNNKVLLSFEVGESGETMYYDDSKNSFSYVCGFQDSNSNGYADPSEVKTAYDQADFLLNLFNAEALDYDVRVVRGLASGTEVWLDAKTENVFKFGSLVWTSTITAIIAAIVMATLFLLYFYHLGSLSIVTTSLVSAFMSFLFMIVTGLEYNALAVVGIVVIALLSLISGVIYCNKHKEEAYRGRTLKKANSEASRKSTLPVIDLHVVVVVIGLMCYLLGGAALHSFSVILILGALAGVVINLAGMKGLMYLLTNTTKLTGKFSLFKIDESKVPDHMADEKQTYYGEYAEHNFTTKKKPSFIAMAVLFVLGFVGIGLMAGLNNSNLFRVPATSTLGSELYVTETIEVYNDEKTQFSENEIREFLADIKLYENKGEVVTFDDGDSHKTLADYIAKVVTYSTTDSKTVEGTTTNYLYTFFEIDLNQVLDGENLYVKIKNYDFPDADTTLNEALADYFEDVNTNFDNCKEHAISLKTLESVNNVQSPEWWRVVLATSVAVLTLTVYMLIRYRLSRGLASLAFPVVTSLTSLFVFSMLSLTGLALSANILICLPVVSVVCYFMMIIVANKDRELVVEDKTKDSSLEHRFELSRQATGIAVTPVLAASAISVFLLICFFGFGPGITSFLYIALILGLGLSVLFVIYAYMPLSDVLYELFSKISFEPKVKKSSKKGSTPAKTKSAEPEEAIFIGIND